jgi:hypothetical protein
MGKMVFYDTGFIFVDNRLNSFVFSFDSIEHIFFYLADEIWMEVKPKTTSSLPANLIC